MANSRGLRPLGLEEWRVVKWRTAEASLSGLPVAKPWLCVAVG
jgi:hypothetical protein